MSETSYYTNRQNWELLRMEIERRRQRPEWKTWAFWLALVGILIGSLALSRDYFGWGAKTPGNPAAPIPSRESALPPPAQRK